MSHFEVPLNATLNIGAFAVVDAGLYVVLVLVMASLIN
jgi:hypothetical protein